MPLETGSLEPAIPPHLRVERTVPMQGKAGYRPESPSYSARFDPRVKSLPMVYVGVQSRPDVDARATVAILRSALAGPPGAAFYDEAVFMDEAGYANVVFVGYWDDLAAFDAWNATLPADWWHRGLASDGPIGTFRECYTPSVQDTETTFSHPYPEGYSRIAERMSGKTDTHEYWGSSRDRIPRAQTEALEPEGRPRPRTAPSDGETLGRHVEIEPHDNLCFLRSGQDWSEAEEDERDFYTGKVQPLLEKGMAEISRDGLALGCYFNRYMTIREGGASVEKTYSISAWHSIAEIEAWVRGNTHLAIWAAGIRHYTQAGDDAKLRTYHELMVLKAKDQSFSYFNCHSDTGMLRSFKSVGTRG